LLVAAACATSAGATYRYSKATATVKLAAGVERDQFDADDGSGAYTQNRALSLRLVAARGTLDVRVGGANGRALYSGGEVTADLRYMGRHFDSAHGGACQVHLDGVTADDVSGSLSCVGLGTHTGKGYDVSSVFRLEH
jgi:hypothetical protein